MISRPSQRPCARSPTACVGTCPSLNQCAPETTLDCASGHTSLRAATARPVARQTATMPPWPAARASDAASNRRPRSSRCGDKDKNRARIGAGSVIPARYAITAPTEILAIRPILLSLCRPLHRMLLKRRSRCNPCKKQISEAVHESSIVRRISSKQNVLSSTAPPEGWSRLFQQHHRFSVRLLPGPHLRRAQAKNPLSDLSRLSRLPLSTRKRRSLYYISDDCRLFGSAPSWGTY